MRTETRHEKDSVDSISYHKSQEGQVSVVTVYNKLNKAGKIVRDHRICKRQKTPVPALELEAARRQIKQREDRREREKRENLLADKLLRDLTPEEKTEVEYAVLGEGDAAEIIASSGNNTVNKQSMRTLAPEEWLGDEVINFYLKVCLTRRDEALCQDNPGRKQSYCFSSFFLKRLMLGKKYSYDNVRTWSQHVPGGDIFNLKYIMCPHTIDNVHLALAVICMEEKRVK